MSLVDLFKVFWKRKWLILGVILLVTALGTLYALLRETVYEYSTTIEIGSRIQGDKQTPIEPARSVVAKLENSYIPEAIRTYQKELTEEDSFEGMLRVDVRSPRDTDLVLMSSQGPEDLARYYLPLQEQVLDRLREDHRRVTSVVRSQLEDELQQATIRLEELQDKRNLESIMAPVHLAWVREKLERDSLEDPRVFGLEKKKYENSVVEARNVLGSLENQQKVIERQIDQIERQEELLATQIEEIRVYTNQMRDRRPGAVGNHATPAEAMTLLLIDSDIQRNLARLSDLEDRLYVQLPNRLAELEKQLDDNLQEQASQREQIAEADGELERFLAEYDRRKTLQAAEVEPLAAEMEEVAAERERRIQEQQSQLNAVRVRLQNLRETRAILPPQQSLEPTGTGTMTVITLSLILGLILGFFAAGFAQLAALVRAN